MDKIPPKTRVVYEFLHAYFDTALAKTTSARDEAMVSVLAKLDSKLDLLSGHMDDVKLSIGIDLDELHGDIGADCSTHVTPSSASVSPREPQLGVHPSLNGGPSESEGYKPDSEQRRASYTVREGLDESDVLFESWWKLGQGPPKQRKRRARCPTRGHGGGHDKQRQQSTASSNSSKRQTTTAATTSNIAAAATSSSRQQQATQATTASIGSKRQQLAASNSKQQHAA
ncbi:hypothetical protein D1007_43311 [Hordeum vulgare]|nr:hypothetical protein D1007_43311 [Hordeum vulgare]